MYNIEKRPFSLHFSLVVLFLFPALVASAQPIKEEEPQINQKLRFLSLGRPQNDWGIVQGDDKVTPIHISGRSISNPYDYRGGDTLRIVSASAKWISNEPGVKRPTVFASTKLSSSNNGSTMLVLLWDGNLLKDADSDKTPTYRILSYSGVFTPQNRTALQVFNFCPYEVFLEIKEKRAILPFGDSRAFELGQNEEGAYPAKVAWRRNDSVELMFDGYLRSSQPGGGFVFLYPFGSELSKIGVKELPNATRYFQ